MKTFNKMVNELFGGLYKKQLSMGRDYIPRPEQLKAMDGSWNNIYGTNKFNKAAMEMQAELKRSFESNPCNEIFIEDRIKKAREDHVDAALYAENYRALRESDKRYNTPKEKHKASEEQIDKVIAETELYIRAKERILKAQRGQVGYGIDKYPEPLNAGTWSIFEALDHIMDESIDRMHYLEMLRENFRVMVEELEELRAFKKSVEEQDRDMQDRPVCVYTDSDDIPVVFYGDHHQYPETFMSGADHDGDSTYIRNCKAKTALVAKEELEETVKNLKQAFNDFQVASDSYNKLEKDVL